MFLVKYYVDTRKLNLFGHPPNFTGVHKGMNVLVAHNIKSNITHPMIIICKLSIAYMHAMKLLQAIIKGKN